MLDKNDIFIFKSQQSFRLVIKSFRCERAFEIKSCTSFKRKFLWQFRFRVLNFGVTEKVLPRKKIIKNQFNC